MVFLFNKSLKISPPQGEAAPGVFFTKMCLEIDHSWLIIGTSRRSIFHAAKSSHMPCTAKIKKINNFHNQIKNPLELRLVKLQKPHTHM